MMRKTGIFGGTFNPPHLGHLGLLEAAKKELELDRILVIPACIPPHKSAPDLAPAADRLEMCRLGLCPDSSCQVSDIEVRRGEKSYTIDTLTELTEQYPGDEFYLIIGSDMLSTFTQWYRWEDILKLAKVAAASREIGFVPDLSCFSEEQRERIVCLSLPPFELCSTEIRESISAWEDASRFLVPAVSRYISETGIYSPAFCKYRSLVELRLDGKRVYHSFCVAREAKKLAAKYGADEDKAFLAGLLHDVMKNEPVESQLQLMEKAGFPATAEEKANPKVLHAFAGAAFVRECTDVNDEEIVSAIRWHTTGRAGMTLLDKVVYLADFISADRTYPDVDEVRRLAAEGLDEAILYTARYTLTKLSSSGAVIHPATVSCFNELIMKG